ncbi:MAG: carotenoid 1,2-hydratase [Dehalococcoidia bacterium]|nr:MAG: carotenoid 1,2-hydratase [Dehalococcoidia bacterium]
MKPALVALLALLLLAGCRLPGAIPQDGRLPETPAAGPAAPFPHVRLPEDEGPHDRLTEWWYYTGHLDTAEGSEFGFELVVFQILRGRLPPFYLAHFAISDFGRGEFHYQERSESRPDLLPLLTEAARRAQPGFQLSLGDWSIAGREGTDQLRASMPGYAIDLTLVATKPPALHQGSGLIRYGQAGYSYYYSRTRLAVSGTLIDHGVARPVRGEAWMDHQWGDFIALLGGGWDWFSLQLDDGSEYMVYEIRDQTTGQPYDRFATRIDPDGTTHDLPVDGFSLEVTARWQSPKSGAIYPAGWVVRAPSEGLQLQLAPRLADQELVTTSGVTYWEGAIAVTGERAGRPVRGRGYAELTGYAPAGGS